MKNESLPQKTNISVMKGIFSAVVVLVTIIISSISVLADITFTELPVLSSSMVSTEGLTVYTNGTNTYKFGASETGIYLCVIKWGSQNQYRHFAAYCKDITTASVWTDLNGFNWYNQWTYDSERNQYWRESSSEAPYGDGNYLIPVFNSGTDAANAFQSFTPTPSPNPNIGEALNISLPAGNVLIADISNTGSNSYYLETTSGTTGAVVKPGMNNIQIGFTSTIPASFTVPNSSWDYPSWSGAGSVSVLGTYNRQSTQGDFALTNIDALKYVVITNPMYPNDNNASANRLNSDLNITIEKVNSYVVYSLQTGYVSGNLIGTNDGSQYIDYQYDEDTGEWVGTNQDGDPASPVWGGQNDFENTPTTINDWLENIAHQISSFFSGAIGAITTLSVAVKNFAGTLMSLYVWLPSPVLSILSSAVMLAIVIGVIKVFI